MKRISIEDLLFNLLMIGCIGLLGYVVRQIVEFM